MDVSPYHSEPRKGRLKRLAQLFLPGHLLRPLKFELHMLRIRLRAPWVRRSYRGRVGLLVNVGSGDKGLPGWVNVDAFAAPSVNCLYDCRKNLPFGDSSARGIFSEHFLEHLHYTEEAPHFVSECYRVLEQEGSLRIIVPDVEQYLQGYLQEGWERLSEIRPLRPGQIDPHLSFRYESKIELINAIFRQDLRAQIRV